MTDSEVTALVFALVLILFVPGLFLLSRRSDPQPTRARRDAGAEIDRRPHLFRPLLDRADVWAGLVEYWASVRADQLHLGLTTGEIDSDGMWSYSATGRDVALAGPRPRTSPHWFSATARPAMLVLGPPGANKTTAVLVPQAILHFGPAVLCTSKKEDLFVPTAQTRARLGRVWHYNPGEGGLLAGCHELRWSPIATAADWDKAVDTAEFLTSETLSVDSESSSGQFFRMSAADILAVLLHAAALLGETMSFVSAGLRHKGDVWERVQRVFYGEAGELAIDTYEAVVGPANERSRNDAFATARTVVKPFRRGPTYSSTLKPNFDAVAFARSSDTIYITARQDDQESLAPLIKSVLHEIREAQLKLYEAGELRQPMYWGLDELASMARLRKFPELVSQSGSTGLHVAACLQDLAQAERLWPEIGKNLLSYMSVVIFPGSTNQDTTEAIARTGPMVWIRRFTESHTEGTSYTEGESFTRSKRDASYTTSNSTTTSSSRTVNATDFHVSSVTASDISHGVTGIGGEYMGEDRALFFYRARLVSFKALPYYRSTPFVQALMCNAVYAAQTWKDERAQLPVPAIDAGIGSVTADQREAWSHAVAALPDRPAARRVLPQSGSLPPELS